MYKHFFTTQVLIIKNTRCRKEGAGGGGAWGEMSGVGGVRVPDGSSQGSSNGSSTRLSSGTTVKQIQSSITAIIAITPIIAIKTLSA